MTNAASRAYDYLREQILSGALDQQLLTEGEVATRLGISRTPVREAFVRLAGEGLLRVHPRRGVSVPPLTPTQIRQIAESRLVIETAAVRALCHCAQPERRVQVIAQMRAALIELDHLGSGTSDSGNGIQLTESTRADVDVAFHTALVQALDNKLLSDFYATLRDQHRRIRIQMAGRHVDEATIDDEHHQLLALLEAGEQDAAVDVLQRHVGAFHAL